MKTKFLMLFLFLLVSHLVFAQKDTIIGILLDINDKPIKKHTVRLGGVSPVTVKTDKYGIFTFTGANLHDTLFVGDKKGRNTVKIPVNGYSFVTVKSLKGNFNSEYLSEPDERLLRAVQQEIKQNNRNRSTTVLRSEDIEQSGCRDIYCLVRRFSGVRVLNGEIFIGGMSSSLQSPTSALIVVDGIADGRIDGIAVEDIDSISILKDASIYGVRGANGAIVIQTKRK